MLNSVKLRQAVCAGVGLLACLGGYFSARADDASREQARQETAPEIVVTKIWDKAPHNAFTDLIRWNGRFYCTFREGERHVFGEDGKIRIIRSKDGNTWDSVALIEQDGVDLRDPKLSITPDGRLMILMGGSDYDGTVLKGRLSRVAFLNSGEKNLTTSSPVVIDKSIATKNDWLWRVVWHDGVGYGVLYQPFYPPDSKKRGAIRSLDGHPWQLHLVKTTDGVHYDGLKSFHLAGKPGEATPLFLTDGRMMIVVRNDQSMDLGFSSAPYTDWQWKKKELWLGGPDLIQLPDETIVLGTRAYEEDEQGKDIRHTVVGTLSLDGEFGERVRLPSGSDTSYPGMVLYQGQLWVTYYSNHEKRASIYLAKIPLSLFDSSP